MTKQAFIAQQSHDIRTRWFRDHIAQQTPVAEGAPAHLRWTHPDSTNFRINYILFNGTLCVIGDLGEAAYCWYSPLQWSAFRGMEFSYFRSKAHDLEGYTDLREWVPKHAVEWITPILAEHPESTQKAFADDDWQSSTEDARTWEIFLTDVVQAPDLDGEGINELIAAGHAPSLRCLAHWIGLQMAVQQLQNAAGAPDSKFQFLAP